VWLATSNRLLVAASVVPSSPILVTLIMEALGSSETSALTTATRLKIPEDTILQCMVSMDTVTRGVLIGGQQNTKGLVLFWKHQSNNNDHCYR
jgi:hypothetical protein